MPKPSPQLQLLHDRLESVLGLADRWEDRSKTPKDIVAAAINYLAQASGIAVAMMPLDDRPDDEELDAPF